MTHRFPPFIIESVSSNPDLFYVQFWINSTSTPLPMECFFNIVHMIFWLLILQTQKPTGVWMWQLICHWARFIGNVPPKFRLSFSMPHRHGHSSLTGHQLPSELIIRRRYCILLEFLFGIDGCITGLCFAEFCVSLFHCGCIMNLLWVPVVYLLIFTRAASTTSG